MTIQTAKNKIQKAMRLDVFAEKNNLPRKITADRMFTQCCKELSFVDSEKFQTWYRTKTNADN